LGRHKNSDEDDSGCDLGIRNAKARLDYGDRWFVEERLLFFGFFGVLVFFVSLSDKLRPFFKRGFAEFPLALLVGAAIWLWLFISFSPAWICWSAGIVGFLIAFYAVGGWTRPDAIGILYILLACVLASAISLYTAKSPPISFSRCVRRQNVLAIAPP